MPKLNRPSQPVARLSKTGYDMSQQTKFTSSVGQLLPVYYDFLSADEEIEFQCSLFTRTTDLETCAMVNVNEHIDLFFVPMNQLCSYFEDWLSNTVSWNSNLFESNLTGSTQLQRDSIYYPRLFGSDIIFLLNWMYKGNFAQYNYQFPYSEARLAANAPGALDEFGIPNIFNLYRLCDLLGMGATLQNIFMTPDADWAARKDITSIFLPCMQAYQKIFFDYYSDEERTQRTPKAFNIDSMFGKSEPFNSYIEYTDENDLFSLVKLRYRPWKKDFFTSIHHSPLMNNDEPNTFGINLVHVSNWLGDVNNIDFDIWTGSVNVGDSAANHNTSIQFDNGGAVNTASIRSMFAIDELLKRMNRSKKTWDYETLAMFGFKPDLGINGRVFYLGSHTQPLQIGEVTSTASTDGAALGEIGGKGYGFDNSSKISFKAPCRGVLMAIYSAVPDLDYNNVGVDRLQTYSYPWDFYNPAFDKLGEQPVFNYQIDAAVQTTLSTYYSYIRGWQPRYMELKQKYDRVCGDFLYTLDYWTASRRPMPFEIDRRNPVGDLLEKNFYIDPTYLDKIFLAGFHPADSDYLDLNFAFQRDPLRHFLDINCYKKSTMSPFGIDNL